MNVVAAGVLGVVVVSGGAGGGVDTDLELRLQAASTATEINNTTAIKQNIDFFTTFLISLPFL